VGAVNRNPVFQEVVACALSAEFQPNRSQEQRAAIATFHVEPDLETSENPSLTLPLRRWLAARLL